jgi:hypothetical protein
MALGTPPLAWFCAAAWPDLSPPLTGVNFVQHRFRRVAANSDWFAFV